MTEIEKNYSVFIEFKIIKIQPQSNFFLTNGGCIFCKKDRLESRESLLTYAGNDGERYLNFSEIKEICRDCEDTIKNSNKAINREYVTGCQALEKLITGEWEKIACAEDENWLREDFIKLGDGGNYFINKEGLLLPRASFFEPRYLKLKKWYEYKEQQ